MPVVFLFAGLYLVSKYVIPAIATKEARKSFEFVGEHPHGNRDERSEDFALERDMMREINEE